MPKSRKNHTRLKLKQTLMDLYLADLPEGYFSDQGLQQERTEAFQKAHRDLDSEQTEINQGEKTLFKAKKVAAIAEEPKRLSLEELNLALKEINDYLQNKQKQITDLKEESIRCNSDSVFYQLPKQSVEQLKQFEQLHKNCDLLFTKRAHRQHEFELLQLFFDTDLEQEAVQVSPIKNNTERTFRQLKFLGTVEHEKQKQYEKKRLEQKIYQISQDTSKTEKVLYFIDYFYQYKDSYTPLNKLASDQLSASKNLKTIFKQDPKKLTNLQKIQQLALIAENIRILKQLPHPYNENTYLTDALEKDRETLSSMEYHLADMSTIVTNLAKQLAQYKQQLASRDDLLAGSYLLANDVLDIYSKCQSIETDELIQSPPNPIVEIEQLLSKLNKLHADKDAQPLENQVVTLKDYSSCLEELRNSHMRVYNSKIALIDCTTKNAKSAIVKKAGEALCALDKYSLSIPYEEALGNTLEEIKEKIASISEKTNTIAFSTTKKLAISQREAMDIGQIEHIQNQVQEAIYRVNNSFFALIRDLKGDLEYLHSTKETLLKNVEQFSSIEIDKACKKLADFERYLNTGIFQQEEEEEEDQPFLIDNQHYQNFLIVKMRINALVKQALELKAMIAERKRTEEFKLVNHMAEIITDQISILKNQKYERTFLLRLLRWKINKHLKSYVNLEIDSNTLINAVCGTLKEQCMPERLALLREPETSKWKQFVRRLLTPLSDLINKYIYKRNFSYNLFFYTEAEKSIADAAEFTECNLSRAFKPR